MPITKAYFGEDKGDITDFSGVATADIFNQSVLPRANSIISVFEQSLARLDAASAERNQRAQSDTASDIYSSQQDDQFLTSLNANNPVATPTQQPLQPQPQAEENYDTPVAPSAGPAFGPSVNPTTGPTTPPSTEGFTKTSAIKLSNYGYDSDSSSDYNSNVLKIGNRNNKLVDGVSAALTRSLAKKHGLKAGDEFEVVTAEGKVLKRRYDDTVPTTYRGNPLPETVDLYELGGNNKFGGKVVGIRPLTST